MGQLRIIPGGLKLEGRAIILNSLIASSVRSKSGQPFLLESSTNFTISTRDETGLLNNKIYLGKCLILPPTSEQWILG